MHEQRMSNASVAPRQSQRSEVSVFPSFRTVAVCTLLAGAVAGCGDDKGSPSAPSPSVDITMSLQPGQTSNVSNTPLSVTFERLVDGRCPAAAICVAGVETNADIYLLVRSNDRTASPLTLSTGRGREAADVSGYQFKLEELTPYPMTVEKIPAADYRAKVRVVRR